MKTKRNRIQVIKTTKIKRDEKRNVQSKRLIK